jgi:helicase
MNSGIKILGSSVVKNHTKDSLINIVLDTLELNKQILIFNASKNSSEATAEKIANARKILDSEKKEKLHTLSQKILKSFSIPTKQCRRLAKCVEKGIAFHHSGLVAKQRMLIEKAFKSGLIDVISSTPTLAAGLNLPAYKVIIKDYKRYSANGYNDIPVLEFHQMAGRAGRPGKEDVGKAVVLVKTQEEVEPVVKKFIFGKPEQIYSKLAVEPTLKMYLLSLISMDLINTKEEIEHFFSHTLYGKQYNDLQGLYYNIFRILDVLKQYNFVSQDDLYYKVTPLGKKVSQLYLNPDTANDILQHFYTIEKILSKKILGKEDLFLIFQFLCSIIEMRPLFRVKKKEEEHYVSLLEEKGDSLIQEYNPFEIDYGECLNSFKTAEVLLDWVYEAPEDYITEKYGITPGELQYKLQILDWILYCLEEFALLKKKPFIKTTVNKLRIRCKAGIKEELVFLIGFKGIGRVRARKLYDRGIVNRDKLRQSSFQTLSSILGEKLAISLKNQLGDWDVKESLTNNKPQEIKVREVTDEEIDELIFHHELFKKEEEKQKSLKEFF